MRHLIYYLIRLGSTFLKKKEIILKGRMLGTFPQLNNYLVLALGDTDITMSSFTIQKIMYEHQPDCYHMKTSSGWKGMVTC